MSASERTTVTQLLESFAEGDRAQAANQLMPLVYDDLRRIARKCLRHERPDHTLQPTALVHEAYLRLVDQSRVDWAGRSHFLAIGAQAMRRVLVDYARRRKRVRRGAAARRIELDSRLSPMDMSDFEILALHEAIEKLAALDAREAQVVEMRFFAGMAVEEVAEVLGVSKRTVEGDWTHAKAWLRSQYTGESKA